MSTRWYTTFGTRLGGMLVTASEAGLTGVYFVGQKYEAAVRDGWADTPGHPWLAAARGQIEEYLAGARTTFSVPLDPQGTPFQQRVWQALLEIPAGTTVTYGELARRVGAPSAARAVGAAVGRNPVSLIVPCHRVVGASGALTGYAGGLDRKRALLELEGRDGQMAFPGPAPDGASCPTSA